jgi:hypothetical protein
MNKNILSPKGTLNSSFFIWYYMILIILYLISGILLINLILKHGYNTWSFILVLLFFKFLLAFNYKKRLFEACNNLFLSVFLGFVFAFDTEVLVLCQFVKDARISSMIFCILAIIILFIQPAIVALLPKKEIKNTVE